MRLSSVSGSLLPQRIQREAQVPHHGWGRGDARQRFSGQGEPDAFPLVWRFVQSHLDAG